MAAGRATTWMLLAAPGVVVVVLAAWDLLPIVDLSAARSVAPDPAAVPPKPGPKPVAGESPVRRPDDTTCLADGHDPHDTVDTAEGGAQTLFGDGSCRWVDAPVVHVTGHLVDATGARVSGGARLRFWSPESRKSAWLEPNGDFDLSTDVEDQTYDVDVILFGDDTGGPGPRRVHVGRVKSGDGDVVLRMNLTQDLLAAGTLREDGGRPLAGWTLFGGPLGADNDSSRLAQTRTDDAGRFRLVGWKRSEPVEFRAETPNGMCRMIVSQQADGAGRWRVTVARPGIAGRVIGANGKSPAGAVVRLRADSDGTMRSAVVDDTGVFSFDRLDSSVCYALSAEFGDAPSVTQYRCAGDEQGIRLYRIAPESILEGRAADSTGAPLARTWLRFVADDGMGGLQAMTDADGAFMTTAARPVDYDAFALVPGPDGRLVPGTKLGRCRGGDRTLALRAPR